MISTTIDLAARDGLAAALAVSGVIHADLYLDGYCHIPTMGPGFLWQAALFLALAVLILAGGPQWLSWLAGALSAGAVIAFGFSRTVGLFGFTEHGWQPAPHAAVSVMVEVLAVVLSGLLMWTRTRRLSVSVDTAAQHV